MSGFGNMRKKALGMVSTFTLALGGIASLAGAPAATAAPTSAQLAGTYTAPVGAKMMGSLAGGDQMTISLVLDPNNAAGMNSLLTALYDPSSAMYHQWLSSGQFVARFGPTSAATTTAKQFLRAHGLSVVSSSDPFLVRAVGTVAQVDAAFGIHERDYRAANGQFFFQNDAAVTVPTSLSAVVSGVVGLSDTIRPQSEAKVTSRTASAAGMRTPQYGAGPSGSGLTPAQWTSLYGASSVYSLGNSGKGAGVNLAVFELSGYSAADIAAYEHKVFGSSFTVVPLVNKNVDGGPVTPACPVGDFCGPFDFTGSDPKCPVVGDTGVGACDSADYSGDIEVEADIEVQIGTAPKAAHVYVYNAPNDFSGQTGLDEYNRIASDNIADSISSSWALCEQDAGLSYITAESLAFAQMATQGQSMFAASGDTGAWSCLRGSGSTALAVLDPASQPLVTGVGGTSFGTYDPKTAGSPTYQANAETVWNPLDFCYVSSGEVSSGCSDFGAGGGGVSAVWQQPSYQNGLKGVVSSYSQLAPYCVKAAHGKYCRETPDVSANADEFTPYAEYCSGASASHVTGPGASECATISAPTAHWFGIGGTSLSSPVWSAVIGLWDSVHAARFGNANQGLYSLASKNYAKYFHDVTGHNQNPADNGYYPTTSGYDMATGLGSPIISAIAQASLK